MVQRYGKVQKNGSSHNGSRAATLTRSEYSTGYSAGGLSTNPAQSLPRQLSTAMSMQSQQSVTAHSTML